VSCSSKLLEFARISLIPVWFFSSQPTESSGAGAGAQSSSDSDVVAAQKSRHQSPLSSTASTGGGLRYWGEPRVVELLREPGKSLGISIVGGKVEVRCRKFVENPTFYSELLKSLFLNLQIFNHFSDNNAFSLFSHV